MKTTQSSGTRPVHQTVAGKFEVKTGGKSMAIGFTDQRLSPHAGSATFWSWLRSLGWDKLLAAALPQPLPTSNNHLLPLEKAREQAAAGRAGLSLSSLGDQSAAGNPPVVGNVALL